ncbi:EEF1A lysine methyltransferase 2 [Phlebotomus argentipes]|uniref:EEF1A lysine methyltransferase 2 n=1 Tax=Phlebotomus argentipes TaxID=94469 RepID=UPI002892C7DE|nr:EEF1A lysine methyltransferase 2 [Phlebotomus argentipes]
MSKEPQIGELNSSELGTKEFWDKSYELEIQNYKSHGDVGEIWFDERSQTRVVNWILKSEEISEEDKVLDIGCGNGMILVELAEEGFKNLVGVDYSQQAIELARSIAQDKEIVSIRYQTIDILSSEAVKELGNFRIAHDKGTFDAICLCPEDPAAKRAMYLENVYNIVEENGFFIITSCNWTEDELKAFFGEKFQLKHILPTPTFQFGGQVGNVVTTIIFQKTK